MVPLHFLSSLPARRRLAALLILFLALVPALGAKVIPGLYIVELTEEAPAVAAARSAPMRDRIQRSRVMENQRSRVRTQQSRLRQQMRLRGGETYETIDSVANALLVEVPDARVDTIRQLPGVRAVYPVHELRPTLERALPLLNVPAAWQRLGGSDLAGAGIKIGFIDTGIDPTHPAFDDPSIPTPEGFPRVTQESDTTYTSNKVIVARSYRRLLASGIGTDTSAADYEGHGTAVAAAAAGVVVEYGEESISGVAPKAYVANYNIFPAPTGANPYPSTRLDVVLKAFDDAVRDGMDVINISLGSSYALRPSDDLFTRAVERATALGVVVVVAAGNEGSEPFTVSDMGVAPSAVTVGASQNDRAIDAAVELASGQSYDAVLSDQSRPLEVSTGPVFDVSRLDSDGLACSSFTSGSLSGTIALILRGTCTFEEKLNNVEEAGAVAAVIYTAADDDVVTMSTGSATLSGVMIAYEDGVEIKGLAGSGSLTATIDYRVVKEQDPYVVADFSSRGPNTDLSIKPDLLAIGTDLNTATLDGSYDTWDGTSFSAPLVSGAAALIQAARPGLSGHLYRSLLINPAAPLVLTGGEYAPVQSAGSGVLDMDASLASTIAAYPTSVSFGEASGSLTRSLTLYNLSSVSETLTCSTEPFDAGAVPQLSETTIVLEPYSARSITLTLDVPNQASGEYEGYIWFRGSQEGTDIHIPYWYGISSGVPETVKIVYQAESGNAGMLLTSALDIRVTDSAGTPLLSPAPTITPVSGGGTFIALYSLDALYPGLYEVDVQLGAVPGSNEFLVQAGDVSVTVTIQGE